MDKLHEALQGLVNMSPTDDDLEQAGWDAESRERFFAAHDTARKALSVPITVKQPNGYQAALDIRAAQGWEMTGAAVPVLYTDTINDQQVCRDDVWLCTTDALAKKPAAPALVGLTDEQIWRANGIMSVNAELGWHMEDIVRLARATITELFRINNIPAHGASK